MASRLKEDEKNERIIRGLLKLPPNRKCINCSTLRAREIYFKDWDPQRHSAPDSSNVDRLRDFIKHVYVDKRYSGERSTDRSLQVKLGDKNETNENRRSDGCQSGSRSPSFDNTYERRYSNRSSPGYDVRRSPGYDQDSQRHSDHGRSPVHSGVVNDWRREDRFSNARKSEDRRSSDGESKPEIRSPDNQKDSNVSSPPVVRPVRDILGENVVPLRIGEPPKASSSRAVDGSTFTQVSEAPLSLNSPESALTHLSVPPPRRASESVTTNAAPRPPTPSNGMFSSSNAGDFLLASLSAPTGTPAQVASIPSGAAAAAGSLPPTLPANGGIGQWSGMQHQQQQFPHAAFSQAATPQLVSSFPSGSISQGLTGNPIVQTSQTVPSPASRMTEVKSSGRKELPAGLFTAAYLPYQPPGWHVRPVPGMGFPMYHPTMLVQSMPMYPQPSKSSNPFDVHAEASPAQGAAFPSMSSLHAALPNAAASRAVAHPSNIGTTTPSWMPPQPSLYPSTMPPLASSFGSAMPGTYMGQQLPSNVAPSRFSLKNDEANAPLIDMGVNYAGLKGLDAMLAKGVLLAR
ncbi:hypothetical protein Cgig2_018642 [Carnegiea gigantea]|uniref:Arf-GAP domain-containing protein n=1 Tax=Carnegiea gigantea TaxID=171969 RepID=A0A9Q1KGG1_9CARY|nr:hypothetical protein Cgig2_018642 [Carnegiea gigantea]